MDEPTKFKHLTPEQAGELPADLDLAAVDELLGIMPTEAWPIIIGSLLPAQPPPNFPEGQDWAMGKRLASEDAAMQAIVDRIYAKRESGL
jgi:hypothetical protein